MLLGRSRVRPCNPLGGTAESSATDVPATSRHSVTIISLISLRHLPSADLLRLGLQEALRPVSLPFAASPGNPFADGCQLCRVARRDDAALRTADLVLVAQLYVVCETPSCAATAPPVRPPGFGRAPCDGTRPTRPRDTMTSSSSVPEGASIRRADAGTDHGRFWVVHRLGVARVQRPLEQQVVVEVFTEIPAPSESRTMPPTRFDFSNVSGGRGVDHPSRTSRRTHPRARRTRVDDHSDRADRTIGDWIRSCLGQQDNVGTCGVRT